MPTAVVVPFRSHAYALKSFLLEHDVSLLGVHFLSTAQLREWLSAWSESHLPLREHLRLLLSIAAEESLKLPEDSELREKRMMEADFLAAKSVARAPDHLLRAIDQLGAAGWDFSAVELPALRDVEARVQKRVTQCGFELIHTADRRAAKNAIKVEPIFANLLVTGFNGAHWPLWQLLCAGVAAAEQATVLLEDPRDEAREIDEAWVGTWEQTFGSAQVIPAVETADKKRVVEFLIGNDFTEQARTIAAKAVKFLSDPRCTRLGIAFPRAGALPRLVSAFLSDLKIAHQDGIAHLAPGPFETVAWRTWLTLQENPQLNVLIRFLNAFEKTSVLFGDLPPAKIEHRLREIYGRVLIDDLAVLHEASARSDDPDDRTIAEGLARLRILPAHATFTAYLAETEAIFAQFDWTDRWLEVDRLSRDWSGGLATEFSRALYLRWLEEIVSSSTRARAAQGDHPYSRVHLLLAEPAGGERWSHLILAGLNEGEWPREEASAGFLREEEIQALNQRIRFLNKRALKQGDQGEGHWTVRDGYAICLGPLEQRRIAERQFVSLHQSAECAVALTVSFSQEDQPDRAWNPSELFSRLYFETHEHALSEGVSKALLTETQRWLAETNLFPGESAAVVGRTRVAYDARRQTKKFGEYEFALREEIAHKPVLRVTQWERVLKAPALVWLNVFLGVEASREDGDAWAAATGRWVHQWLARIGTDQFSAIPPAADIVRQVRKEAFHFRTETEELCAASGRTLPDWWISGWRNALYLLDELSARIGSIEGWEQIVTEFPLPPGFEISLGEGRQFPVRGRIDVLLGRGRKENPLGVDEIWVIDYKTGKKKKLVSSTWNGAEQRRDGVRARLLEGDTVQIGLYTLAVHELGVDKVSASLISLTGATPRPELALSDFEALTDIWQELQHMQQSGIFGMRGFIRSPWSFQDDYPLATLEIDVDQLDQKWGSTHEALALPEDEEW
jgi:PD-(D/E)XK nuclease superfamily